MKRQVLVGSKLCATVLSMLLAFHPVFAQAQAPEITVTIFRDLVRFVAPSEAQEVRIEVFSSTGEKVFDSNFVAGQTQDWPMQNLRDQPVDSGLYAYTITIKDQAGILKQVRRGNIIVNREREGLEAAPPIDRSQAKPTEPIQQQPTGNWDADRGKSPYVINTPAMGIGTQSPLARLQIGAGTAEPMTKGSTLLLEEGEATGMVLKSTTGSEMFFSQDKWQGLFGTVSNHPLGIRTNNQNRFWITSEGNIGIGTTNPSSPLTVAGTIEMTSGGIKFPDGTIQMTAAGGSSTANPGASPGSDQKNGAGLSGKKGVSPAGVDGDWMLTGNAGTNPSINFLGTTDLQPLAFRTNGSENMRIIPSGSIGIGTPTPVERLDLAAGRFHIGGQCGGAVPNVQGAYLTWNQLCGTGETDFINHQGLGGGGFAFMNTSNGTPNGTNPPTLMFLTGGGKLGIGTTNPLHRLHLSGTEGLARIGFSDLNFLTNYSIGPDAFALTVRDENSGLSFMSFRSDDFTVNVAGILSLFSNRTRISGFDGAGFHWFGPQPDSDLAFGIRRIKANQYELHVNGSIITRGKSIAFVEDHPNDSFKEIVYVALEGPEAGTYIRGTAKLLNGEAVVDLPEHFSLITSDEGITAQITPRSKGLRLYIAESSAKRLIIREENGSSGAFDYLVQGVRKGFENHQVIQNKKQ